MTTTTNSTTAGAEGTEGTGTEKTGTEGTEGAGSTTTSTEGTDTAAEIEKWKKLSRKHEDQAKANAAAAKELETLRQKSMTDQEKAVDDAKTSTRQETLREVGGKLAEASIRVAAAGRNVDVDALVEGIDATKFLDDNGDPDTKAITAWVDRVAPVGDGKPGKRDLGLGARSGQAGSPSPAQDWANFLTKQLNETG